MFEFFINFVLTALFLQSQSEEQATIASRQQQARLPQVAIRELIESAPQRKLKNASLGVELTAAAFLAVDWKSQKVLAEKNAAEVRSIASLTKLMTALVFLEHNPGWNKVVTLIEQDARAGGIVFLLPGEEVRVKDLFYTMLVSSSNEAAVALTRSTGLTSEEFARLMNQKAAELGMTGSFFVEPTGLDSGNQGSAFDLALLVKEAFSREEVRRAAELSEYQLKIINKKRHRRVPSTDKILGRNFGLIGQDYQVAAGKTGYLKEAGYCFGAELTNQSGHRVIAIVLGSASLADRFKDVKGLGYWVFNNYRWK